MRRKASICMSVSSHSSLVLCFGEMMALRKHAYSNILKILPPKNENFQIKNSDIFHISAQEAVRTSTHNLCF